MITDLVASVNELIKRYGYDTVYKTVEFVNSVSAGNRVKTVQIGDWHTNIYVTISEDQFNTLRAIYHGSGDDTQFKNKIQTIKALREMTAIGLKEAKDIVENTAW